MQTEDASIVEDLSHTNSIHKVYIAYMGGMEMIQPGDGLLIYRTKEQGQSGWYTSVATSLCVVEEARPKSSFDGLQEFIDYSIKYSVFNEVDLRHLYARRFKNEMFVVKMTYNIALPKRPIRQKLVQEAGLDSDIYWGFFEIPRMALNKILEMGKVYEGTVIY